METACPHCSQGIEIAPEILESIQGSTHFDCPVCGGAIHVPVLPAGPQHRAVARPRPGVNPMGHRQLPSVAKTRRGMNRNLLILGTLTILTLGGLGIFIASRNAGNIAHTTTNLRNEILNNSYFTNLIASGATTEKDLETVTGIRAYGAGFIGVSTAPLTWDQSVAMAKRTSAAILDVQDVPVGSRQSLLAWLTVSFPDHFNSTLWVMEQETPRILDGSDVLVASSLERPRKVFFQWGIKKQTPALRLAETNALNNRASIVESPAMPSDWINLSDEGSQWLWRGGKQEEFAGKSWIFEDGMLKSSAGGQEPLVTRMKFRDFELEFEWKLSLGTNSGICYSPKFLMREFEIIDDLNHPEAKDPRKSSGSLCHFIAPSVQKRLKPVNEFNQGKLIVNGSHVEHWINGSKVVEYELNSPALNALVASNPYVEKEFSQAGETPLWLEPGRGKAPGIKSVSYRNMRIRKLNH